MTPDFQRLFESLPGLYLVLSPDLRILAMSDAYARVAMQTREAMLGRDLFAVFPGNPDDPADDGVQKLRASLDEVRRTRAPHAMAPQRYDVRDPRLDGSPFVERHWIPVNTPVLGAHGEIEYIIHGVQDVTEIVGLRQAQGEKDRAASEALAREHHQLVEAMTALEATNEELEAFCYSVAHDLRAPLRGIQGFSQALLEDYARVLDDTGRDYLTRVSSAAMRMSHLIDDLLTLSRISRAPLARVTVDLSSIARLVASELAAGRAQQVAFTAEPHAMAHADPRLAQIVLENLLGNAWKFCSKIDSPVVHFGVTDTERGRAFFVRDNGAGFDSAYAAKLFSPFQRLHSEKEFPGTGIGLATVQRIVRRHGGRVWAAATVNGGATFYFTLPD